MGGGGGKGGGKGGGSKGAKSSSRSGLPEFALQAAERNLGRAEKIAGLPYAPYYAPEVASFNPQQILSQLNTLRALQQFGLGPAEGTLESLLGGNVPQPTRMGGFSGYSSAPLYELALRAFQQRKPEAYRGYRSLLSNYQD